MLLRSLFAVVFIAALGAAIMHAATALANARVRRAAGVAADRAFARALAAVQEDVAAQLAGGANPRTFTPALPSPIATCGIASASGACLAGVTTQVRTTAVIGSDAALQENDAIDEGRFAVQIRTIVSATTGATLAQRDRYVLFRSLRVVPYVALAGSRDASFAGIASQGDDGAMAGVTTIDVQYVNAQTGDGIDANAWSAQTWTASPPPSAWDP